MNQYFLGIDWGGTKIEIAALDSQGTEVLRRRVPTPQHDYAACLSAAASLVEQAEHDLGQRCSVGIGIPGSISPFSGRVQNANSTWLNGQKLDRDLAALLERELRFANDANCLALSEAVDGAGSGAEVVFAIIIGTGCGAGLAVGGKPLVGRHCIAGEWGHNPLPGLTRDELPGPDCYCGRRGCIETYVSGTGFARDYSKVTGDTLSAPQIVEAKQAGKTAAVEAYLRFLDRLARGIASVVNIVDPDIIVLGGGMSNVDSLYLDLPGAIAPYVFCDTFTTPVARSQHGDSSGVRGAAWLWRQE